jgi:hypothetical protein
VNPKPKSSSQTRDVRGWVEQPPKAVVTCVGATQCNLESARVKLGAKRRSRETAKSTHAGLRSNPGVPSPLVVRSKDASAS